MQIRQKVIAQAHQARWHLMKKPQSPSQVVEAKECYGTSSLEHPTVASLVQELRILEIIV